MKVGTIIGISLGLVMSYFIAEKLKVNLKDKGKKVLKEKICDLLD